MHRVIQASGVRSRLAPARGRLTPFVGREQEMGILVDRWERVLDGEGQTVLVRGAAGIGKSRLVLALRERLLPDPHTWLECRGSLYTQGSPFHPMIELLASRPRLLGARHAGGEVEEARARRPAGGLRRARRGSADRPAARPPGGSRAGIGSRRQRVDPPADHRDPHRLDAGPQREISRWCCSWRTCTGSTPRRSTCSARWSRAARGAACWR